MPDYDDSLGDQNTFDGSSKPADRGPQSLGDEATLGGGSGSDDGLYDDDMEVVDLESRYTTEGTLGKGGMGEVLLATDTRLNRKVAIKRILGSAARSKTAVNRFLTEAQSIAALNHPNIVQIYDYGRANDGPFLIMEYVEGSSLLDKCREGAIPVEEAIELACQLCDGLGKAHAANIVHRDIKPANVLLTPDGVPKLTDFGLAKAETADTGMTMAGAVLGTLDFMPPEQRRDAAEVDARSDLWALAATFYQMVTGKSPKIIKFNDVPKSLHDVLGKALEDEKDDRYQTALEFKIALQESLAGKAKAATQPVPQTGAELGAGECPECHIQNDASRKFCSECAAPLRVSCLKCETKIPVWDKVCGECGGKQADLLPTRVAELKQMRVEAEQFRSKQQYETSIQLAQQLSAIEDDRLLEHKTWGDEFLRSTEELWEREKQSAQRHFEESKKHRRVFDYSAAIKAIEAIPEPLRSAEIKSHLLAAESEKAELNELMPIIKKRVKNHEVDGLLELVDRAIELRGESENLTKLQQQLTQRAERKLADRKLEEQKLAERKLAERKLEEQKLAYLKLEEQKLEARKRFWR
ncbi:protein kinase [bacterium]|nr:protein kinase [bacterium]